MVRSLLLLLGAVAITIFEFVYYPGHSYLAGETQNLIPMMERLRAPGFLSRDLVATNPNLTYTIFDEVTLFLVRVTHHSFPLVLAAQQLVFRFAGVFGVLLLTLAAGLQHWRALAATTVISAGILLPGLHLAITDPEPTPVAFSLALTVLAFGFLARAKPLLAGFFGGLALAYQPCVAAVFWVVVLGGYLFQRSLRPLFRATLPALLVFSLLLANASQLQPGRGESHPLFERISAAWGRLQMERTPELWVSTWGAGALLFYLAGAALSGLMLYRLWPRLSPLHRWLFVSPFVLAAASVAAVLVGFEWFRWALIGELQPARSLLLAFIFLSVLVAAASEQLWQRGKVWMTAGLLAGWCAGVVMFSLPTLSKVQKEESGSVETIAQWAVDSTWGGSMFLFPDSGEASYPGLFRGLSMRAIYVDWTGGELMKTFPDFAVEWDRRWQQAGAPVPDRSRLYELLHLPIEYVVLRRRNMLPDVKAELVTPAFVVYDAHLLGQRSALPSRSKAFNY